MPRRNDRAEDQNARYDRYAEILESEVSAEEIEVGNRVLHGQYLENFSSRGREVVKGRAGNADKSGKKRGRKS
jgi:hypothetical protein